MKTRTLFILLLLLSNICFSQSISWKQYLTLDSANGTSFIIDSTAILSNAFVPGINIANDSSIILGYAGLPLRGAAITADTGKTFTPITGLTTPMQVDGGFVYLNNGQTRFICEEPSPTNTMSNHNSRIVSYISSDGKNWIKEAGIRYQPGIADDSISSVPEVIQVNDSIWRMYYVGDFYNTNGIRTAISNDWGWTWTAESGSNILSDNCVDPHPVYLSDGKIRLYHKLPFSGSGGIGYIDGNGLNYSGSSIQLFSNNAGNTNGKFDPFVIKYPNGKVACYIGTNYLTGTKQKIIAAWSSTAITSVSNISSLTNKVTIFPNPFNASTTIQLQAEIVNSTLTIYNIFGQKVKSINVSGDEIKIDRENLLSGIYFIRLTQDDKVIMTDKLVIADN
ncbi:MAG: T9SS type A sorting domain-containing protein [Bacteroidales bacterium]|nr:T9SS type A sorting domain-containing protein [Bacteroidales bacterium]